MLVQVCRMLGDEQTFSRELRGLKIASDITGCKNCAIITFDEERELEYEGLTIKILPAWKWLLDNPFRR